jgi:phosphate:Na+ symporter
LAAAVVLGENIGTTITANLAAMIGNVHAKRAARAHFIFNVFGVVWMMLVFYFYLDIIDTFTVWMGYGSPLNETSAIKWGLTFFHISFNIINTSVMVWFINVIVKVVEKMVPMKADDDDEFHLEYMGTNLLRTAELSLLEARKEVVKFGKMTKKMNGFLRELIETEDSKRQVRLMEKIQKYEDRTDEMELEINNYLIKVLEGRLSTSTSFEIKGMLSITNDLERVADIILRMSRDVNRKIKNSLVFSPGNLQDFTTMFDAVDASFDTMIQNLGEHYSDVNITEARTKENEIDRLLKQMNKEHLKSIDGKEYDVKIGIVFRDILFGCEKVGDHIINVTEGVIGDFQKED